MLGGKYLFTEGNKTEHCKCEVRCVCVADTSCECKRYCKRYASLYAFIHSRLTKECFITFNPKPVTQIEMEFGLVTEAERFNDFITIFNNDKNIVAFIAVAELTLKGQMHYHVYLRFKDKVTFIKKVVQPFFMAGNVLPVYGAPKQGLHYLFKTSKMMKKYLGQSGIAVKYVDKEGSIVKSLGSSKGDPIEVAA